MGADRHHDAEHLERQEHAVGRVPETGNQAGGRGQQAEGGADGEDAVAAGGVHEVDGAPVVVTTRRSWTFLPRLRSPATTSRPRM